MKVITNQGRKNHAPPVSAPGEGAFGAEALTAVGARPGVEADVGQLFAAYRATRIGGGLDLALSAAKLAPTSLGASSVVVLGPAAGPALWGEVAGEAALTAGAVAGPGQVLTCPAGPGGWGLSGGSSTIGVAVAPGLVIGGAIANISGPGPAIIC